MRSASLTGSKGFSIEKTLSSYVGLPWFSSSVCCGRQPVHGDVTYPEIGRENPLASLVVLVVIDSLSIGDINP